MRLRDLNQEPAATGLVRCSVCIIGAGAAGLYLASRLAKAGLDVVLLEAGGTHCSSGDEIGITPAFPDGPYPGAIEGRFFGWGGSTARWGGVLIPHSKLDLRKSGLPTDAVWEHIVATVDRHTAAVMANLGLRGAPDFHEYPERILRDAVEPLRDSGLAIESSEFLPFRRRNLSYLLETSTGSRREPRVFCNAVASGWTLREGEGGVITEVEARSLDRRTIRVAASHYVVATGALEAARILLELDQQTGHRLIPASARVGEGLSDHLSCAIGAVASDDATTIAGLFGPRFSRGRMRGLRFIESECGPSEPRHFAHFLFKNENPGFALARDVLSQLQQRRIPRVRVWPLLRGLLGLTALAWYRFGRKRLYIPRKAECWLQLDLEQAPHACNSVSLLSDRDRYGRPVAAIRWRITDEDRGSIQRVASRILQKWPGRRFGMPEIRPIEPGDARVKPHDAYHPAGCTRMGTGEDAVVNMDLRVRGTENLWVVSTGVFPTAGTANPTFSMLCLAERLCETLRSKVVETS